MPGMATVGEPGLSLSTRTIRDVAYAAHNDVALVEVDLDRSRGDLSERVRS